MGPVVMNGMNSGTDGGKAGTNRVIPAQLFGLIAAFLLAVILVNISSHAIEDPKTAVWEPALWEFSSYFAILILLPLLYIGYWRFHWRNLGLTRFFAIQVVIFLMFSLAHIALMVGMRTVVYAWMHQNYNFAQGHLFLEIIYEVRKDALTFVLTMGIFWAHERLSVTSEQPLPERIEVKSDGRTLYLTHAEIIYAEAAGNYVELYLTTTIKPLLLRGTLSEYEKRLSAYGFVRIHRSRLLNRQHMRSFTATPSGDLRITLTDGREITASRRFRGALDG